jgi:hypothetical protein
VKGVFILENTMDPTTNEIASLLYVALATAAGGKDLLDDSNEILNRAVRNGSISRPDTRRAITALVALTSSKEFDLATAS